MSESLGEAVLVLDADSTLLDLALNRTESDVFKRFKAITGSAKMMATAGITALGGIAIGAGAALFKIGESFDDAYDKIRVGTGATGEALERLKGDFKNVIASVPTDFDSASTAITEINRRLGLTGKPLQGLAKQFLELSRITGTDLTTNIETVSKAFVDWEVPVKRQSEVLDGFFRLSQESGISVDALASSVQKFGSPLRTLGFTLEESASMFAMFEKAGVNTQTMVPGLKLAIANLVDPTDELSGKLDKLGVDAKKPNDQLRQVFDLLSKDGLSATEKMSLAMDVFGSRAGADLAEAVKQGRFEVGDLMKVMTKGKDTIRGAGRDTMDFSESWQLFKNRAMLALEPVAIRVFALLSDGMKWLAQNGPAIFRAVGDAVDWLKRAFNDIKPALVFMVEQARNLLNNFKDVFRGAFDIIKGIVDVFVGIIHGDFSQMWKGIKSVFSGAIKAVIGLMKGMTAPLRSIAGKLGDVILKGFDVVKKVPGFIGDLLGKALDKLVAAVSRFASAGLRVGKAIVKGIADGLSDLISRIGDFMAKGLDKVVSYVDGFLSRAARLGSAIVKGIGDGLGDLVAKLGDWIGAGAEKVLSFVERFVSAGVRVGKAVVSGIGSAISQVASIVGNALAKAIHAVGEVVSMIGRSIADWLNDNTPLGDRVEIDLGPKTIGFTLPALAGGAQNFRGGVALVGEEGPELVNLPRGSDVHTARRTASMLSGGGGLGDLRVIVEDGAVDPNKIRVIAGGVVLAHERAGAAAFSAGVPS